MRNFAKRIANMKRSQQHIVASDGISRRLSSVDDDGYNHHCQQKIDAEKLPRITLYILHWQLQENHHAHPHHGDKHGIPKHIHIQAKNTCNQCSLPAQVENNTKFSKMMMPQRQKPSKRRNLPKIFAKHWNKSWIVFVSTNNSVAALKNTGWIRHVHQFSTIADEYESPKAARSIHFQISLKQSSRSFPYYLKRREEAVWHGRKYKEHCRDNVIQTWNTHTQDACWRHFSSTSLPRSPRHTYTHFLSWPRK